MGVFADAMEAAANAGTEQATPAAEPSTPSAQDSPPESSAARPGTAPSTPTPQTKDHPSPTPARTPSSPARPQVGEQGQQGKQVDLRALHEARTETKSWKDAYGWLPREEVGYVRQFMQAYKSDPSGTLLGELEPHLSNPQDRQRIVSWLQERGVIPRGVGRGNGHAAPVDEDAEPQPDFRLADGTTFMSAERQAQWRAWHARQDEKRIEEKLQPIQQFVTQSQRHVAQAAAVEQANRFAEGVFADARKWPHFSENQQAIAAKYPEFARTMTAQAALYRAYVEVLQETVFPSLSRTEREKAAADLQARSRATTPNPTRPTGASGDRRPESFRDAAERILGGRK